MTARKTNILDIIRKAQLKTIEEQERKKRFTEVLRRPWKPYVYKMPTLRQLPDFPQTRQRVEPFGLTKEQKQRIRDSFDNIPRNILHK
ncbi:hypothetical protein FACS189472_14520 [Alphaproteobacteria bacterium]|nr:hypothetical protein FACS189472_14520 [Alphaproteobacteria bacterium]